jgi:hypothetical protein
MYTGKPPYAGLSDALVLQRVLVKRKHPDLPEDASIELRILWPTLMKCWSRIPQQRPNIMQLMRERYFDPATDRSNHDGGFDFDMDEKDNSNDDFAVSCSNSSSEYSLETPVD